MITLKMKEVRYDYTDDWGKQIRKYDCSEDDRRYYYDYCDDERRQ